MAITISILDSGIVLGQDGLPVVRTADIEIADNGGVSYFLRVGNIPVANGLQVHLNSRAAELYAIAQSQGIVLDVMDQVKERIALKAIVALMVKEINTLRQAAGLPTYTAAQVRRKLRDEVVGA
jgi:hypothetical protein